MVSKGWIISTIAFVVVGIVSAIALIGNVSHIQQASGDLDAACADLKQKTSDLKVAVGDLEHPTADQADYLSHAMTKYNDACGSRTGYL